MVKQTYSGEWASWFTHLWAVIGRLGAIMSGTTSVVVCAVGLMLGWSGKDVFLWSAIAGLLVLSVSVMRRSWVLTTPQFEVECNSPRSYSRNNPRILEPGKEVLVDFLGIEIRNIGTEPILKVHADLVEIEKPSGEKSPCKSALNFGPRDNQTEASHKGHLIVELDALRNGVPEMVCLISISGPPEGSGFPMFGTFGLNWRDGQRFEEHLAATGNYIFTVILSSETGSAFRKVRIGMNWNWTRAMTRLNLVE